MKWEVVVNFSLHFFNIILFFWGFKKFDLSLKLIGVSIFLTCIVELYALKLMLRSVDNNFIYHFLTPIQYALFAAAYAFKIHNLKGKKIILYSIPVAILLSLIISVRFQKLDEYNSFFCAIKHSLLSFWILYFFYETFLNEKDIELVRDPFFWISTGLLFSSLGNFFIEGLMSMLIIRSHTIALNFYLVGVSLTYLSYLTITVAFLLQIRANTKIIVPVNG